MEENKISVPKCFFRVSKSEVINLNRICSAKIYSPNNGFSQHYVYCKMPDGDEIRVEGDRAKKLIEVLNMVTI